MAILEIQVNGEPKQFQDVTTVGDLLVQLGRLDIPCAVEVNERLVPKTSHARHELKPGDRVELVTLVGGG